MEDDEKKRPELIIINVSNIDKVKDLHKLLDAVMMKNCLEDLKKEFPESAFIVEYK